MIESVSDFKCDEADYSEVVKSLKRLPSGPFRVAIRNKISKIPVVIMNYPILNDGSPMPTLYWLIGKDEMKRVSRIEAQFGLRAVEEMFDDKQIRAVHTKYRLMRDKLIPEGYIGLRPRGGVGGTTRGLKCLHAHLANFMATGEDEVGGWVFKMCGLEACNYESE